KTRSHGVSVFWLGPDKLCFGSDYAIWSPKWLIEKFMAFELPEDLKQEYHVDLTFEIKRKILDENTARLYGIDIAAQTAKLNQGGIGLASFVGCCSLSRLQSAYSSYRISPMRNWPHSARAIWLR